LASSFSDSPVAASSSASFRKDIIIMAALATQADLTPFKATKIKGWTQREFGQVVKVISSPISSPSKS
jgi:hypothetical protein